MKQGWEIKKLGDIAKFYRGLTYSKGDEVPSSTNMVLRSNNVDLETNALVYDDMKCLREDLFVDEDKKVKANSILICMSNGSKQHIGKVAYIQDEIDYAFGGFMGLIVPSKDVAGKYLYYSCISHHFKHFLAGIGNGIGITNLRFSDLSSFCFAVPTIAEQEKIVAELDCLSGIIEKKKQQLKELDNLAQSIFYEMFGDPVENDKGWVVKKLGEVCDVRDGTHDSPKYLEHSEYVLVTSKNITSDGDIDFTTANYISKEDYDAINKRSYVDFGDIIMAMIGTIGKPIIVKETSRKFCIKNVALIKFEESTSVTNTYIQALLSNNSYASYIQGNNKGGTQKFIALGTIRKLLTPIPPLTLQQDFASKIESIEKQKELIAQSIKEAETLFNSRMDYYFN